MNEKALVSRMRHSMNQAMFEYILESRLHYVNLEGGGLTPTDVAELLMSMQFGVRLDATKNDMRVLWV